MQFSQLCFGIIVSILLVILLTHQTTFGELCARGPYQSYSKTDEVFLGQITSKEPFNFSYNNMKITLDVKQVFKGKYNDTFTVFYRDCGYAMGCADSMLQKGKQYVIYGYYSGNNLFSDIECGFIRPASMQELNVVKLLAHTSTISPMKQLMWGIPPQTVTCSDGMVLIKKIFENSVACVKPSTAQKLVERGWSSPTTTLPKPTQGPNVIWGNSTISFVSINPISGNSPLNVTFHIVLKRPVALLNINWSFGQTFGMWGIAVIL